ncbi:type II secretion system F family protein [Phenylobacterium soli]|uniref:Pilus assembly protein TadB n=1 Tax=Phenylobacterium soli TaxID=2170551 RepID=A0A328AB78_9CAUL|nr:type II secretion system F family protein [Phenylobacterium soli]RAK51829.1 pilus assembly protein TadB [Phenylobacterium soli]
MSPLLILMLVGAAAAIAAAVFDVRLPRRGRLAKRARRLAEQASDPKGRAERALRRQARGRFDALVRRLLPRPAALQGRLEATGYPITFTQYGLACGAVLVTTGLMGVLLGAPAFMILLESVGSAVWLPHVGVGFLMARRRARFFKLFPEAIGLIVRGLRAGLPVSETIGVVGRETPDPVGEEFRRIADQVRLGEALEDAMWRTARRLDLPEFNFLVISLSVQRETGGNLAETLENLEQILRRRKQMTLKIKAMASEATWSALIIGALPFIMAALMYMVSADYMKTLFTDPLGHLLLAGALASLTVGGLVMRKMTRFEI